jgi:hypothetical protein
MKARGAMLRRAAAALLVLGLLGSSAFAEEAPQGEDEWEELDEISLEDINRQLENPLTRLWSLTLQENLSLNKGDLIDGRETSNTLFFQPALPLSIGDDMIFIARPVFPMVTNPILDPSESDGVRGRTTGFGDIEMFTLFGPNRVDGVVWGIGSTFRFPTATSDRLGQGKYQAGPAAMFLYLGERWTLGTVTQHWWSYAGDSDRSAVSQTNIQYIARRKIPGAMSIGMGPTIVIDWKADGGNKVTLPIGLGITKTIRIGRMPVKLRLEPQYSIIRPDDYGTEWNIRLQITPVIPNPFN